MLYPRFKIEVYDETDVLRHTIFDAETVTLRMSLADSVGTFQFNVPAVKQGTPVYHDIEEHDTVKFHLKTQPSKPFEHIFTGKVSPVSTDLIPELGYFRTFEGQDLGELLERQLKRNTLYLEEQASDIVTSIAQELDIYNASKIEVVTENLTYNVVTESYLNLLKNVSDSWIDGSEKVQADFYVDKDGELVWKLRPLQVADPYVVRLGENVIEYACRRDIIPLKNRIRVYGAPLGAYPSDRDAFTEQDAANWVAVVNNVIDHSTASKVGTWHIQLTGASTTVQSYRPHDRISVRDINTLQFWSFTNDLIAPRKVRLHAPDSSNYFEADLPSSVGFELRQYMLGEENTYNEDHNPEGEWVRVGNANWWSIHAVEFDCNVSGTTGILGIDGLHYSPVRYSFEVEDAASIAKVGLREAEYTDDKLLTEGDVVRRAYSLLRQQQHRVDRLDLTFFGLAPYDIGTRVPITLLQEGYSETEFDVVNHDIYYSRNSGLQSKLVLLNTGDTRLENEIH